MEKMSARRFEEWRAFDLVYGVDGFYQKEMIAQTNELIQVNNQLTGAAITKKGKRNPAGKFRPSFRPWRIEEEEEPQPEEVEDDSVYEPGFGEYEEEDEDGEE